MKQINSISLVMEDDLGIFAEEVNSLQEVQVVEGENNFFSQRERIGCVMKFLCRPAGFELGLAAYFGCKLKSWVVLDGHDAVALPGVDPIVLSNPSLQHRSIA